MYTRQHVCTLANIEVERFKNLVRRDQLPSMPPVIIPGLSEQLMDRAKTVGWN